jgi:hypothetical protein
MASTRQHRRTSLGDLRTLAEQLYAELEQSMYGTPADRDALVAACGSQLTFLAPLLDVLSQNPDQREQTIQCQGTKLWQRPEPASGVSPVGWLAIQLARVLCPYLLGSRADRDRLLRSCGSVLAHSWVWITTLTLADRDKREEIVARSTECAPVLSLAISATLHHSV